MRTGDSKLFDPFYVQAARLVPIVTSTIYDEHGDVLTWYRTVIVHNMRMAFQPSTLTFNDLREHALRPAGTRQDFYDSVKELMRWYLLDGSLVREEIVGTDRHFSMREDTATAYPYVAAALLLVVDQVSKVNNMKCMSCKTSDLTPANTKVFRKMLICNGCFALAEKAEREIEARINAAKEQALQWLDQHVLRGGLLTGGTGDGPEHEAEAEARRSPLRVHPEVPKLQGG